jgi:hypothetical protein
MKQFGNSPTLLTLLADFDQWVNADRFSADFLAYVWDISTAQGFGLDIWGRILGQSRYIQIAQSPGFNFGFNIGGVPGTQWQPWSQAPFYGGAEAGPVSYALEDSYYRQLLLVKAAANIARCDCPSINALMRAMFGDRGKCYVGYDPTQPMHVDYYFDFTPTSVELSIIESGLFPQPAGTLATYTYTEAPPVFEINPTTGEIVVKAPSDYVPPAFAVDPATGELSLTTTVDYAGPDFILDTDTGELEVTST